MTTFTAFDTIADCFSSLFAFQRLLEYKGRKCMDTKSFFEQLDQTTNKNERLDLIFETFFDLFREKNVNEANSILAAVTDERVEKLSVTDLIGLLSITIPQKTTLPGMFPDRPVLSARAGLCQKVRTRLERERPDDVESLLRGLE